MVKGTFSQSIVLGLVLSLVVPAKTAHAWDSTDVVKWCAIGVVSLVTLGIGYGIYRLVHPTNERVIADAQAVENDATAYQLELCPDLGELDAYAISEGTLKKLASAIVVNAGLSPSCYCSRLEATIGNIDSSIVVLHERLASLKPIDVHYKTMRTLIKHLTALRKFLANRVQVLKAHANYFESYNMHKNASNHFNRAIGYFGKGMNDLTAYIRDPRGMMGDTRFKFISFVELLSQDEHTLEHLLADEVQRKYPEVYKQADALRETLGKMKNAVLNSPEFAQDAADQKTWEAHERELNQQRELEEKKIALQREKNNIEAEKAYAARVSAQAREKQANAAHIQAQAAQDANSIKLEKMRLDQQAKEQERLKKQQGQQPQTVYVDDRYSQQPPAYNPAWDNAGSQFHEASAPPAYDMPQ